MSKILTAYERAMVWSEIELLGGTLNKAIHNQHPAMTAKLLVDIQAKLDTLAADDKLRKLIAGKTKEFDQLGFIMQVEEGGGTLTPDEVAAGVQRLIDNGTIVGLQGSWQRLAQSLIDQGLCYR